MSHPWSTTDDAYLTAMDRTHTAEEIARTLKRSAAAVECRRKRLGLSKRQVKRRAPKPERLERMACDPSREAIEAAVNAIRAAIGLESIVWPETRGAEEQRRLWENVA